METIYKLQQRADALRRKNQVDSITPEEVGGLHADTLAYLADMEQNADGLGIHQVYKSYAAMKADGTAPVGTNGKPLRFGQLVAIYDANNSTQAESGNVYAFQKGNTAEPWLLMGNLGSIYALQKQVDQEIKDRGEADNSIKKSIEKEKSNRSDADTELLKRLQGTSESSNALTDPFLNLGNFTDGDTSKEEQLQAKLDAAYASTENYKFVGVLRATFDGVNVQVHQFVIGYAREYCIQVAEGPVRLNDDGRLASGTTFAEYMRTHTKENGWTEWTLCGGKSLADNMRESIAKTSEATLKSIDAKIGQPGGIAQLDENSTIPKENLPKEVYDVVMVSYWDTNSISMVGAYRYSSQEKKLERLIDTVEDGEIKPKWVQQTLSSSVIYVDVVGKVPYIWTGTDMAQIAPKATPASIFNATTEVPITGYYQLSDPDNPSMSAINAAWKEGKAVSGLIISFEMSAGIWKTYQYVGKTVTEANWFNPDNWKDFGSLAAGSETYIIIDTLLGNPEVGSYWTLATAVQALLKYQEKTGVQYAKKGLIISYSTGEKQMETKQFQGDLTEIGEIGLWKDFGGGSGVDAKDDPKADGKDALSTGGAYKCIPTNIKVDTETEGVVKLQLENAAGEGIGDEQQFAVGTGSGGGSGTIVSIQFENSPLYAKAGGSVLIKAAIRSITTQGGSEIDNMIEKIVLKDRDTNQVLETIAVNKASSATGDTYDFTMDVSSYFVTATNKRFQLVAYDDAGNSGSRNINVSGVDVSITSVQTLNYTQSTSLAVGGTAKSIPMYKFANNASDKGIKVITEIYVNEQWQVLGTSTIMDTYSHSVSIDPQNCMGTPLAHGAYPLRIHGEDVGSGVVGNYLHTSVMVVEEGNVTPIVATRWYTDEMEGKRKLYESISVEYAIYVANDNNPKAVILYDGSVQNNSVAYRSQTYTFTKQVMEGVHDGSKTIVVYVECGESSSQAASFVIDGSLVDVEEVSTQRVFNITMDSRSNSEEDKTIKDGDTSISVEGSNWSTNGFVKDTFGTASYGTEADNGIMSLRIAENMRAVCDYKPFASNSIEQNGMAISFTVRVKNMEDRNAKLIDCLGDNKVGFYLTGEKLVFTCDGATATNPDDLGAQQTAVVYYAQDAVTRFDIVIEPSSIAPYSGIGSIKIFRNGDEAGACYYDAGKLINNDHTINFDGTSADIYLYKLTAWATYFNFRQAVDNYLVGLKDTKEMLSEYEKNLVMASQTAEGTTKDRPTMQACLNAGLCCITLLKNPDTDDIEQNYPGYLDKLDGDKKTKALFDWIVRFPDRPWQDFKVVLVPTVNQGTTSSLKPIKNKKGKFKGCKIILLHSEEDFTGEELEKFKLCQKMAAKGKIQVKDGGMWISTSTIKVDYSDSGGANNGATMELMNKLQRALGERYMTPAQNAYKGNETMNTSIDSVPCALFRTDINSVDATNESYAYFHAKANFNVDKNNPSFFGFEKVDGYTADCLNYGDFKELVAAKGQKLTDFKDEVLKDVSSLVAGNIYMLSEYCGNGNVFLENDGTGSMVETTAVADPTETAKTLSEVMSDNVSEYDWTQVYHTSDDRYAKYSGGNWKDTTGSMSYDKATRKWTVSGRVLNPTTCYEYLKYDYLCWLKGVNGVDDMMRVDEATGNPVWMSYFEARYPDDDDLVALYESGKKVPYDLYKFLMFTQQCSNDLTEADGDITLDGLTVRGTKENRLKKWSHELHKFANVHSVGCYVVASDYILAVDQRSKNMMLSFYLDTDGEVRAYFNHWYDGDCVWNYDNDCGLTVPWDLDAVNDPKHYYQGWNSVMFQQSYKVDGFWLDETGDNVVTLHDIAGEMRSVEADGMKIFSVQGCTKLWVTDRLAKWAKVISSFDGERKYIENSTAGANYYYAVHGLRLDDLPETFRKRFAYRDGYYQVGELYTNPFKMRAVGTEISIAITAAQDSFFGIGVDRADACVDSCYLKAGESYTLRSGMTASGAGTMLYVFGAKNLARLDLSGCTPKAESWDISNCEMLQELVLGGEDYEPMDGTAAITQLNLGNKPFLSSIDVRNTKVTSITATYCPRLKTVLAKNSSLSSIDLAEASPIEILQLPSTMSNLSFKNLPRLQYPGGLTFDGMGGIKSVLVTNCPRISSTQLLLDSIGGGASIKYIRLTDVNVSGSSTILQALMDSEAVGLEVNGTPYDESGKCSGLTGRWIMTDFITKEKLASFAAYFPEMTVYNSQYSAIVFDDTVGDPQNITNLDNKTGHDYSNEYKPSAHVSQIWKDMKPVIGIYDQGSSKMTCIPMDEKNYSKLADGRSIENIYDKGEYDAFMYIGRYWYKGINDVKHDRKYLFFSSLQERPLPSANVVKRVKLQDILLGASCSVCTDSLDSSIYDENGNVKIDSSTTFVRSNVSYNAYKMDVEGMKQVRWPGVTSSRIGAIFVKEDGSVIETYNLTGMASDSDFMEGDYTFTSVPDGAKYFIFAVKTVNEDGELIAVDSSELEAIEPDWVEHKPELVGIYEAAMMSGTLKSVSGVAAKLGDGNSNTYLGWAYDSEGKVTYVDPTDIQDMNLHYTYKDFQNLAWLRGNGYQIIDYETSKDVANLFYALVGNRDAQLVCGYGRGVGSSSSNGYTNNYKTGYWDSIGKANSPWNNGMGNKVLGIENFMACNCEWMDNVGVNIKSYVSFLKNKMVPVSGDMLDSVWHIYDPLTKTERTVQGINANGYCIGRVRFGRYADVVPTKLTSDNSKWNQNYTDIFWYTHSSGRVLYRASSNANAYGGLAYACANYASSFSGTNIGSRLAFRGAIELKTA